MKPRSFRNPLTLAFAATFLAATHSAFAVDYTWTGLGTDNSWGTAANWLSGNPGTSTGNSSDTFTFTGTNRLSNFIIGSSGSTSSDGRYINKLIFDSDADSGFTINTTSNNSGAARQLNFRNANASITVESGSAGNHLIGHSSLGSVFLNSDLTIDHQGDGTLTIQRPINGNAGIGFTKNGSGQLILSAANTYSGGTILNQGSITLSGTAANLGSGPLQVNNDNSTAAGTDVVLTATASNLTVGSLSGTIANPISGSNTSTINTAGRTFTVNQTANGTYAGTISGTGGNFTLGASSTHTLTLTGANTYTGATNVTSGTLLINGSTSSTSLVTVGAGGTLGGSGTVGGATTVNGTLSPGNSPGKLDFGNILTLNGTTLMEIDGTNGAGVAGGHDLVNLTGSGAAGALTYGGAMTIDIGVIFGSGIYSWDLFDFASESGTFSGITLADQYSGNLIDGDLDGVWNLTSGDNTWQFTESTGVLGLTVVPEPSAALLGGLGLTLLLLRRRF